MAHLLLILLRARAAACPRPARGRRAAARGPPPQRARRIRRVVQHQRQHRRVELAVVDRQRFRARPAAARRCRRRRAALPRGVEHVRRPVDRDHPLHVRRHVSVSCPVPQPRSPTTSVGSIRPSTRPEVERVAEQILAKPIPLARRRGEELLRLRPAPRRARRAAAARPARGRRAGNLLADERPQPLARRVQLVAAHAVEPARAVAPRRHPVVVGQRLQVPADARLRHLQHRAQLRHRQLVLLEQQQHRGSGSGPTAPSCAPGWGGHTIRKSGCNVISAQAAASSGR